MNNVIITGAGGFIGTAITKYFLDKGCNVLALYHHNSNNIESHPNLYQLFNIDVINHIDILEEDINEISDLEWDTFIHLAWQGVNGTDKANWDLQKSNAEASLNCMKLAKNLGCSRFVFAGSLMEYESNIMLHSDISNIGSFIYGYAKTHAHFLCKSQAKNIGIDFICPIITNAYGPGEKSKRFICSTIKKVQKGENLQFTSGIQNYDFVYIDDIAQAFYLIADKGLPNIDYVIGSGNAKPLKEFIIEMLSTLNYAEHQSFGQVNFSGVNLPIETFSIEELQKLGYEPKVKFSEGILKTAEWIKEN